ncbi:efflux RND transporter permease subunit [Kosmotoga pacifica]|uniref:efflux RND transporter permease subunit n=1 Tax=Kosmotoga pacifica TaxID=1330330 RepID=UPI00069CA9A9|nr:MMPL family transporter [Kosmotoga pacifica]
MFKGYVDALSRGKKLFFVLLVLINFLALIGVFKIRINPDITTLLLSDSPANKAYSEMEKLFNSGEQLIFVVELPEYRDEVEKFKELRRLQSNLESLEGISSISGPTPKTVFSGLRAIKLEEITAQDIPLLKKFLENMGELNPLRKIDGKEFASFNIFLSPEADYRSTVKRIEEVFSNSGFVYYGSGNAFLQKKLVDYILLIIFFIPPLAAGFIFLVFRSQIGSTKNTILSILPAGLGALWTVGLMGWTGKELSIMTILAPIFTIVMGSADGIHYMSHFTDNFDENNRKDTVRKTLEGVGLPMVMTTLTTIVGFLSLLTIGSAGMGQLAIFAATGVGLAGVATWLFLPLITLQIRNFKKISVKPVNRLIPSLISRLWGKRIAFLTAVYVLAAIVGIYFINVEFNQPDMFKKSTWVYKSFDKVKEINGGGIPIFLLIETPGDPLNLETARVVLEKEKELKEKGLVNKAISVYDVMSYLNKNAYNLDSPEYPRNFGIANFLYILASNQAGNPLSNFLLRDKKLSRAILFPRDLKSETLQEIKDTIANWNDEGISFSVVGVPYITKEMNDSVIPKQISSLFVAIALVFVMLLLTFKSFLASIYATFPIGVTLVGMFGLMGYAGIPLNIITATMASITIGVGIDYAIHYSVYFKLMLKTENAANAARKAFEATSRPIVANALGLALGLTALLISPLRFHSYMSALMWFTMLSSSVFTLALLPTIYSKVGKLAGIARDKTKQTVI